MDNPCPSWLIKPGSQETQGPLVEIINLSLEMGVFPEGLKEAVVAPPLKKPTLDPMDMANYHPVSNLSFLGKEIERAAAEQLQKFLDDTSVIHLLQSGFCPSQGTGTALVTPHRRSP